MIKQETDRLESRFNYWLLLWLVPILPFLIIPLILLFKRLRDGYYYWETFAYLLILPAFATIVLWVLAYYLKRDGSKIIISKDKISIGKIDISFDQVSKVQIQGNSLYTLNDSKLILKNNSEVKIKLIYYRNKNLLKNNLNLISKIINGHHPSKFPQLIINPIQTYFINDFSRFTKYRQTIFKSFFTYYCWFMILFIFWIFINYPNWKLFIVTLFFTALHGSILFIQYHYFLVSEDYLTIKNYYVPWYKKTFKLTDITSAYHFVGPKGAESLILNFINFTTKGFPSKLLNDQMYNELINKINAAATKKHP